jgi:alkanesulfonate monooxygenase SsuD/methylene tetrahydromethanopterin reductase-like flavin-dependent oxidoreductase (luciferase family)
MDAPKVAPNDRRERADMTVSQCAAGTELYRETCEARSKWATAIAAVRRASLNDDEERLRRAKREYDSAAQSFEQHRHECAACKQQNIADLQLCEEGERLATEYLTVARDVLKKSDAAPNDSGTKAPVVERLEAFLRHKKDCGVCR